MGCTTFDGKTRIYQNVDREELMVIRLQDSFYKSLTPEQNALAHANEYDLDSPNSIDFDLLVEKLKELKQGSVVSERQSSERDDQSNISRTGSALTSPSIPSRSINAKARPSPSIHPMWSY
jgi:uridine kinase